MSSTRTSQLLVGTSGFSYAHWRERFYPAGLPPSKWLEYYAERYPAVELNVTFYRLPAEETFRQWARRTPVDFRFAIKGSRLITHNRRLREVDDLLAAFMKAASALEGKLDCILWQLPPRMPADPLLLSTFCDTLQARTREVLGDHVRHAFEFRDAGWFDDATVGILRAHGYALVKADPPVDGQRIASTGDFAYLRFHHGPRDSGAYTSEELRTFACDAAERLAHGSDVYAFFNNDPSGWAPRNADEFIRRVRASEPCTAPHTRHASSSL